MPDTLRELEVLPDDEFWQVMDTVVDALPPNAQRAYAKKLRDLALDKTGDKGQQV